MNEEHLKGLASPEWAELLRRDLFPWVTSVADLGDDVLEVGPGPGLTTDILRERARRVTAVEVDPELAARLAERLAGTNVEVVNSSATSLEFPDGRFSAAACFAALHHVPSRREQDQILAEVFRVLRPAGALVGSDAYDNEAMREHHAGDVFVPSDPDELVDRLGVVGFVDARVQRGEYDYRFFARKPG